MTQSIRENASASEQAALFSQLFGAGLARRVDRLRLCGNGVVPLVAAHALRILAAELLADGGEGDMKKSRFMSLVVSVDNVIVGYAVGVATQIPIFPIFGLQTTLAQNLTMGAVFTVVSIARSFAL